MLGRTNISDEESEQVRALKIDGSVELLISFMGKNIQHVISNVLWNSMFGSLPQLFSEDNVSIAPWFLAQKLQFDSGTSVLPKPKSPSGSNFYMNNFLISST